METNDSAFIPGDILEINGETYQVLESQGDTGLLIPFPSDDQPAQDVNWKQGVDQYRKIGHAQLPGPTPCSTGDGSCPTDGKIE